MCVIQVMRISNVSFRCSFKYWLRCGRSVAVKTLHQGNGARRDSLRQHYFRTADTDAALLESMAGAQLVALGTAAKAFEIDAAQSLPSLQIEVHVDLEKFIDVDAEKARLERQLGQTDKQIAGKQQKLSNESFVSRAPQDVVAQERASLEDLVKQRDKLIADLEKLKKRS